MQSSTVPLVESVDPFAYRPLTTALDEMSTGTGEVRPHWQYFMQALTTLGPVELQRRCQEARRLLRDNGVTYSLNGDPQGQDRPWELDPVPLLIASDEWRSIERGLMQRAELLKQVLADLYGRRESLKKGLLPPEMIYAHPGFLRACHGTEPPGDRCHLPLYAVDLARGPDGAFYVVGDRTQAPPGAGYALENRIVLSRVLPSLFRDSHVHRVAAYFRTLRNTLTQLAWRDSDSTRVVVLSSGALSETYFEHAYLAKYLGYTLVEGADLTVRDGRVWLKTLDGLQPVDVILRCVDDAWCDPLELRPDSLRGVAGLLQAARLKQVAIANPLGVGVLENPAMKQFLPALARHFLGEELLLKSPPTYWCGFRKEREYVLANLHRLVIKTTARIPGTMPLYGRLLDDRALAALRARILAQPYQYVGQEELPSATIPVFADNALEPRRMILRSFLVASGGDYTVMPGGLTRVATALDAPIEPVQSGGISKDTWVLASEPEQHVTLVRQEQLNLLAGGQGELPSRVAEGLYWLGRYAERSESIIRLLRTVFLHLLEPDDDIGREQERACRNGLLRAVTALTESYPGFIGDGSKARLAQPDEELLAIFLDRSRSGSLASNLNGLLYAARSVRDRISPDIWRVFNEIDDSLTSLQAKRAAATPINLQGDTLNSALEVLNTLLTTFAAFTGLALDSMIHGQGWKFLMLGRRLERAQQTGALLRTVLSACTDGDSLLLERLLVVCDSLMTYRSRYRTQVHVEPLLDLLLQDETNPRSLSYQLKHLHDDIRMLPRQSKVLGYKIPEQRLALQALSAVRLADTQELAIVQRGERPQLTQLLAQLVQVLPKLSDAITNSYFSHAEQPQQLVRFGAEGKL